MIYFFVIFGCLKIYWKWLKIYPKTESPRLKKSWIVPRNRTMRFTRYSFFFCPMKIYIFFLTSSPTHIHPTTAKQKKMIKQLKSSSFSSFFERMERYKNHNNIFNKEIWSLFLFLLSNFYNFGIFFMSDNLLLFFPYPFFLHIKKCLTSAQSHNFALSLLPNRFTHAVDIVTTLWSLFLPKNTTWRTCGQFIGWIAWHRACCCSAGVPRKRDKWSIK